MNKIWRIWGGNLPTLFIEADSCDIAIDTARKFNKAYCAAQIVKQYTSEEWSIEQYTGRWSPSPYYLDMVERGEIPADYIGRRTLMEYEDGIGTSLLTEGKHFLIDDDEGRKYWPATWKVGNDGTISNNFPAGGR